MLLARSAMRLFLAFAIVFAPPYLLAQKRLGVFVPVVEQTRKIEKTLAQDENLSGMEITVFAGYNDFQQSTMSLTYDYLLTTHPYAQKNACKPVTQLMCDGKNTFQYRILSQKDQFGEAPGVMGVIDILGLKGMKEFIPSVLKPKYSQLKRVFKMVDLGPMLILGNADYILVESYLVGQLKALYKTNFYDLGASSKVPCPVVCAPSGNLPSIALRPESLMVLGLGGVAEGKGVSHD